MTDDQFSISIQYPMFQFPNTGSGRHLRLVRQLADWNLSHSMEIENWSLEIQSCISILNRTF
jgi:hypothetical protein